ncbi:unnamed protein product [Heligmosomoides polygyrus]|uniref:G_PROTEIN_RECEP_F1_2 domain-containing protein n=1 Tax=Heligmosomoides polygyrus TaxID=6339 RepID=A0A183GGD4_HELPZ|nr:unnamed protein product [Heligmosomoides polygyrus]
MYFVWMELEHRNQMPYCLITSLTPPVMVIGSISFLLLLQVSAIIIFEVLMRINKWKTSRTVLPYKKGDVHDIGNYRPICLLCAVYKLFTLVILSRISRMKDSQAGFRRGFSTIDHIPRLIQLFKCYVQLRITMVFFTNVFAGIKSYLGNTRRDLLHSRSFELSDGVISKLYQVRENLRTMKTLMLFFLLSCVNSFCYNLLRGFVHLNKDKFSRPMFYALIEISIHLPQFSLILPAVLWYSYRKVSRKAVEKHIEKLDKDAPENTKLHFSMIAESWK